MWSTSKGSTFILACGSLSSLYYPRPYALCLTIFQQLQACSGHRLFQWVNKSKPVSLMPMQGLTRTIWTGMLLLVHTLLIKHTGLAIYAIYIYIYHGSFKCFADSSVQWHIRAICAEVEEDFPHSWETEQEIASLSEITLHVSAFQVCQPLRIARGASRIIHFSRIHSRSAIIPRID